MNTDTGKIYDEAAAIDAAQKRGEPLVEVSAAFASRYRDKPRRSQKFGNALAQLAKTHPHLSLEERERLAEKVVF